MDIVYIDKYRYEIREQEVSVWYTGIYPPISNFARNHMSKRDRKSLETARVRYELRVIATAFARLLQNKGNQRKKYRHQG
jgi:hypothetical protein